MTSLRVATCSGRSATHVFAHMKTFFAIVLFDMWKMIDSCARDFPHLLFSPASGLKLNQIYRITSKCIFHAETTTVVVNVLYNTLALGCGQPASLLIRWHLVTDCFIFIHK